MTEELKNVAKCQYWSIEEPCLCKYWNVSTTTCTYRSEVGGIAERAPSCNLIGTSIICAQYILEQSYI